MRAGPERWENDEKGENENRSVHIQPSTSEECGTLDAHEAIGVLAVIALLVVF